MTMGSVDFWADLSNQNEAKFYKKQDFNGGVLTLTAGADLDLSSGTYKSFNNEISSIRIGANVRVLLCRKSNCGGNDNWII